MEKDFDKWNKIKKGLNDKDYQPPLVTQADIWWVSFVMAKEI